jgi:hypothetical protein
MGRLRIRFGVGTLLAAVGGGLVGAGVVVIRVGVDLEEMSWVGRLFAPSGKPHVLQGAILATLGLVLILLSALRTERSRRR